MRKGICQIMFGIIAVCLLAGCADGTQFGSESMVQRKTEPKSEVQKQMFLAVKKNDLKEAARCLKLGAGINDSDENGLVPLHFAAVCQHIEMVKWLLANGADVNKQNDLTYWTPLHYALGSDDFTEKLCPVPNSEKTLKLVKILVEAKADVNAEDDHGITPVYLALVDLKILKYLSEHGGCLDAGDAYRGEAPLHIAVRDAPLEVIEFILEKGGKNKINAYDGNGYTPLHNAIISMNLEAVKCLVEHGANINLVIVEEGKTPLDLADDDLFEILQNVSDYKDDPSKIARYMKKRNEIVKYLKAHGAVRGKDRTVIKK